MITKKPKEIEKINPPRGGRTSLEYKKYMKKEHLGVLFTLKLNQQSEAINYLLKKMK